LSFDDANLFDLMDSCHSLGDTRFGGSGSRDEDILVGYIYGVLSESSSTELIHDSEFAKVYRYGDYNYIVWMGEFESEEGGEGDQEGALILPVAVEGPFKDDEIREILSRL